MSQFPHDKFAKNLFELLLTPFGSVNLQQVIQAETKFIDIYFEPHPHPPDDPTLGLLAQCLNQHPVIFEPYRNPVAVDDIQMCLVKVFEVAGTKSRAQATQTTIFTTADTTSLDSHTNFGSTHISKVWCSK